MWKAVTEQPYMQASYKKYKNMQKATTQITVPFESTKGISHLQNKRRVSKLSQQMKFCPQLYQFECKHQSAVSHDFKAN